MIEEELTPLKRADMTPEERAVSGSRARAVALMVLGAVGVLGISAGMFWLMGSVM